MSEFFLNVVDDQDTYFEGFFDGTQKPIPDNTELECVVIDGFIGMEDGEALNVLHINIAITTPGEFLGQKYRYKGDDIYGFDTAKKDRVMKNLSVLDTQAGSPLARNKLALTTENVQEHWVGAAHARVKIGAFTPKDEPNKIINTVRGFGFLREKLPQQNVQKSNDAGIDAQQPTETDKDVDF